MKESWGGRGIFETQQVESETDQTSAGWACVCVWNVHLQLDHGVVMATLHCMVVQELHGWGLPGGDSENQVREAGANEDTGRTTGKRSHTGWG